MTDEDTTGDVNVEDNESEETDHESLFQQVRAANYTDQLPFLTDRGNGLRFRNMFQSIVRYNVDEDKWLIRDGAHWRMDDDTKFDAYELTAGVVRAIRDEAEGVDEPERTAMLKFAMKSESDSSRWRMMDASREHVDLRVRTEDLDANFDDLAVVGGIVDLKTGEFRRSGPNDICTRVCKVTYDPDATSPHLDRYLNTFMPDPDDQDVLFATLGTAMRGGNASRVLPIFIGGTTTGKSQLMGALEKLLGDYICTINVSVFRGNMDDKPRPDLFRAMHHRIAYSTEASKVWELHADQVKRLTGGVDPIAYRNLHSQMLQSIPRFTPIIVTNHMPRVRGADDAFKRRLLTITFDKTLAANIEDPSIRDAFINDEGCLRALLARLVRGARSELMRDGIKWDRMPSRYALATMGSFDSLDHIQDFINFLHDEDMLETAGIDDVPVSACAKMSEVYTLYKRWVTKFGNKQTSSEQLDMKDFNEALRARDWVSQKSGSWRWLRVRLQAHAQTWGL